MNKKTAVIVLILLYLAAMFAAAQEYEEFYYYRTIPPSEGSESSNSNPPTPPQPQRQLTGYRVTVRGPVQSNGTVTQYGSENYQIYITNRSQAEAEAKSRFMHQYHVRQNVSVVAVDPMYEYR